MSTQAQNQYQAPAQPPAAAGRSDMTVFAGIMLVVAGFYHALTGLAGVFRDQIYVQTPDYLYQFDLTAWGWTHLLLGALVLGTGVAVLQGAAWGRVVGLGLVVLSLLANFLFLPHYPVWSILIIALDVAILCALATAPRAA
jgi:hypothetical protein